MKLRTSVRLPVHDRDWRLILRTLRYVLSNPPYLGLAGGAALLCLTSVVVAQNGELFVRVVVLGRLPPENRVRVLLAMYPFLGTSFEPPIGLSVLAISVLVGIDTSLLTYHVREHGISVRSGTSGTVGTVGALVAAIGAGCVVCGTSLLAGLLSLVGVTGGVLVLPFEGLSFMVLAVMLSVLSIFWIAEGMHGGMRKRESIE